MIKKTLPGKTLDNYQIRQMTIKIIKFIQKFQVKKKLIIKIINLMLSIKELI